jgi:hypothetical protein
MDVHDGLTGPRGFGSAPPSRNTSNTPSFIDNARWRSDALHDGIERNSSCNSLKLAFIRFDDGAHGGHRSVVFRAEWMVYQPRSRTVIVPKCLHDVPPCNRC